MNSWTCRNQWNIEVVAHTPSWKERFFAFLARFYTNLIRMQYFQWLEIWGKCSMTRSNMDKPLRCSQLSRESVWRNRCWCVWMPLKVQTTDQGWCGKYLPEMSYHIQLIDRGRDKSSAAENGKENDSTHQIVQLLEQTSNRNSRLVITGWSLIN